MPTGLNLGSLANLFLYATAFFGAFLAALWLSLAFWAYRDAGARSHDRLAQILAAAVVLLLGPAGLVVYLVLRPRQTLDEAYQRALEEEALLTEIEDRPVCPGCGAQTRPDWQICPHCHTRLLKACTNCNRLMELPWQVCPYCASPVPGGRTPEPTVTDHAALS
ncbi:MAG: zinc ribbon domain-containing protein [Anaerolineales bacterium]|jgi:RNA polymerase subunit RPABC4/transcription elongation factor Spt4